MTFIFIAPIFAVVKYNLVYFGHPSAEYRSTLSRRIYRLTRGQMTVDMSSVMSANTRPKYWPIRSRYLVGICPSTLRRNLLTLWCVEPNVLITSAVREVMDSRSPGMFQSCIWMSRSCFGISSTGKFVTCGLVLGFDIVTPEWVGDIARSLPVLSVTINI